MSETTLTIGPWTYRRHKEDWQYQTYGGDWLDVPNAPHALTLDTLAARERELAEARKPMVCSVCVGSGKPLSGKPCICGGVGTEQAEMHGLRVECFRLSDENERLRADLAAVEAVEAKLQGGGKLSAGAGGFAFLRNASTFPQYEAHWVPTHEGPTLVALGRALLAREADDAK